MDLDHLIRALWGFSLHEFMIYFFSRLYEDNGGDGDGDGLWFAKWSHHFNSSIIYEAMVLSYNHLFVDVLIWNLSDESNRDHWMRNKSEEFSISFFESNLNFFISYWFWIIGLCVSVWMN